MIYNIYFIIYDIYIIYILYMIYIYYIIRLYIKSTYILYICGMYREIISLLNDIFK